MSGQLTFDMLLDRPRLETLGAEVLELMEDGCWRTLEQIRVAVGRGSEAGISARLRELRNTYGYTVERRRIGSAFQGLWEYRLLGRVA